eukprot:710900-Pelagomonas_calceolata.AAC.4
MRVYTPTPPTPPTDPPALTQQAAGATGAAAMASIIIALLRVCQKGHICALCVLRTLESPAVAAGSIPGVCGRSEPCPCLI